MYAPIENELFESNYTLGQLVDCGSYGRLYLCKAVNTEEQPAIPLVVKVCKLKDEDERRKCCSEYMFQRIMYDCQPDLFVNVIEAYYDSAKSTFYIVMEHITNGSLDRQLPRNEAPAREYVRQLLRGLSAMHHANIVHRDIKPQNILLHVMPNGEKQLKLIDFGHAKFIGSHELINKVKEDIVSSRDITDFADFGRSFSTQPFESSPMVGTWGFQAYDAVTHLIMNDSSTRITTRRELQKDDVFAVGVVLYMMVTGTSPFLTSNNTKRREDVLKQLMREQERFGMMVDRRTDFSEGLKTFLKKLCAENPNDRPTAAQALRDDWFDTSPSSASCVHADPQLDGTVNEIKASANDIVQLLRDADDIPTHSEKN